MKILNLGVILVVFLLFFLVFAAPEKQDRYYKLEVLRTKSGITYKISQDNKEIGRVVQNQLDSLINTCETRQR